MRTGSLALPSRAASQPCGYAHHGWTLDGTNKKGYRREHLHDSWRRYVPTALEGSATSATGATAQVSTSDPVAVAPAKRYPLPRPTCDLSRLRQQMEAGVTCSLSQILTALPRVG
jgi:hypothetical protein